MTIAGQLEAVASWSAHGLVVVTVAGRPIGSWRPLRFWRLRRLRGSQCLERYDLRTPEWTRSLAERALESGESRMPVMAAHGPAEEE